MTGDADVHVELDDRVLERLAVLICGDDTTPYYRTGREIGEFFRAAKWTHVHEVDGYRVPWVVARLRERREDSDGLNRLILRLADPREYLDEDAARVLVVRDLNQLLSVEGYRVGYLQGRPCLTKIDPTIERPMLPDPLELRANLAVVVSDQGFGEQLQGRLDEAYVCWKAGAPTAAIIMLGSLLEGALYDVATSRHESGKKPTDHLASLIDLARDSRWIARDVVEYAHVLRGHRNFVHPKKQWDESYVPDYDTVQIAWNVVVAALNDLGDTAGSVQK